MKESKTQRKARRQERIQLLREWAKQVRKHIKLPDNLSVTLIALVDASKRGRLKVTLFEQGEKTGNLVMHTQAQAFAQHKFWMVGSPTSSIEKTPTLRLFTKVKQDVCVYTGNHYLTVNVKTAGGPSQREIRRIFAK